MPSDDIRVEVEFLPWHGLWTVDETFYMKSNVLEPGPAVVDGFNSLFICEGNEVHTVKLASPPPRDNPDENTYCGWGSVINGHNWIWELPSGWKITSLSGDLNTATNTYEGFDEVKIQAPSTLPGTATLNVRSEDDGWNWPINTETVIILGAPPAPTNILYENGQPFPDETCISGLFGREIDLEALNIVTIRNIDYLEWSSDAGLLGSSTTPDAYNTLNLMYPGTNRYILPNGKYYLRIITPYGSENRQVIVDNN